MHIKQMPDDFYVEELTDVEPTAGGHALYRLEKRGWTTSDALEIVRRRWRLQPNRVSYGGLKDRHAHTVQYLSVLRGPRRQLNQQQIHVAYLGQIAEPYGARHIRANRFRLIVRNMTEAEVRTAEDALAEVRDIGVPNYFDDQRFGSVSTGGQFVARHMVRGEPEAALRLALTAPYAYDRNEQKQAKTLLRDAWGDWAKCQARLPRGPTRNLIAYLAAHPEDFRGALERLRPELRGLYLSAYQSHVWNRMLALWLEETLAPDQLVAIPLRLHAVPMPRAVTDEQRQQLATLTLPLPSARAALADDDPRRGVFLRALAEEKLQPEEFRLNGFKEMFFSKGERPALCLPAQLEGTSSPDELHPGRLKLELQFELQRGSYATLIVKRITRLPETDLE